MDPEGPEHRAFHGSSPFGSEHSAGCLAICRQWVYAAATQRSRGSATQHFSNYKDCIIATSVHGFERGPFEGSFVILSRKSAGGDEQVVHAQRLERTFAYSGDARAAASQAAQTYVDNRIPPASPLSC
jgi:hypothetical protein